MRLPRKSILAGPRRTAAQSVSGSVPVGVEIFSVGVEIFSARVERTGGPCRREVQPPGKEDPAPLKRRAFRVVLAVVPAPFGKPRKQAVNAKRTLPVWSRALKH